MTLAELEHPHWNAVQQRDRFFGTSLTGVKDAFALAPGLGRGKVRIQDRGWTRAKMLPEHILYYLSDREKANTQKNPS
jgi:hypothetical protein